MAICGLGGRPFGRDRDGDGDGDGGGLPEPLVGTAAPAVACWDEEEAAEKGDGAVDAALDAALDVVDAGVLGRFCTLALRDGVVDVGGVWKGLVKGLTWAGAAGEEGSGRL